MRTDFKGGANLMKWNNVSKFYISGLNQEKLLNELSKSVKLCEIDRKSKSETCFTCSYFDRKKVEKLLKGKNIKVQKVQHEGLFYYLCKMFTTYGLIAAFALFAVLYSVQSAFVVQYQVLGVDKLSQSEVVGFVKSNFSNKKSRLNTKDVEVALLGHFKEISFVSCMIKGQTLVVSVKEKLLPEEMYGNFAPLVAQKDAKITQISLISGTLKVKVGDIVQKGDVLVEPYTIDTSGQIKKVEAKAEILAEVYNEASVNHFEKLIEVKRTGRVAMQNTITLFGLSIYTFKEQHDFKMYEVEKEDVNLAKNLFLPFKMQKTYIYETKENVIESKFEDVKEQFVEKAKQKVLENLQNCDNIKEEFYTTRQANGVTIVNYCIITNEVICSNVAD